MTAVASPNLSAAVTPRNPPRITIAVLMYHSGRMASWVTATNAGKRLPTSRPATRATRNPASAVRFSDHEIPNVATLSAVAAR